MSTPNSVSSITSVSQLPHTGAGGAATPSVSIVFLLAMGMIAGIAGLVLALSGREREIEDDGITLL
jgi:hypothetical protein